MRKLSIKRTIWLIMVLPCWVKILSAQGHQTVRQPVFSEHIYIHFDKPYYNAGETIWLKVYLYQHGLPSLSSREIFLQLEDKDGIILEKKRYPVSGATTNGSIAIDPSLQTGYYTIRAITPFLAANAADNEYQKILFINNPAETKVSPPKTGRKISLQFFAEGGNLIDRIRTQVAFKATDQAGSPVNIEGFIKSDSQTVVAPFRSLHDGIGRVSFTPHINQVFFAEVSVDGVRHKFPLPDVINSGVYLKIRDADSGRIFELTRSRKDKERFDSVRLIVTSRADTVFETRVSFGNDQAIRGVLKTDRLPSGILHFKILNKFDEPLGERLSFINNKEYISNTGMKFIQRDNSKRGMNSVELSFSDTVQRSFSISITDAGAQAFPDRENIYSRLLLTSDLRGYVHNPAFYFEKDDSLTLIALDNLMLTHGWTRYTWKKNLPVTVSDVTPDSNYLICLTGAVKDLSGQPVSGGTLNMQVIGEDSTIQAFETSVTRSGKFIFDSLLFFGDARIYYSYSSANGKIAPVNIELDKEPEGDLFLKLNKNFSQESEKGSTSTADYQPTNFIPAVNFDERFKVLDTVFLKTKTTRAQEKVNDKYASTLFRTSGKLILDNITSPYNNKTMSVIDYVLNNIRTLNIYRDEGILVNRKNFSLQSGRNWKVELFIDENVAAVPNAASITMDQVALIKFYEAGFVGVSSQAPGGAVAIYLKKHEDQPEKEKKTGKFLSYQGYSLTQEFYSPDYSLPAHKLAMQDNRITLVWKTMVSAGPTSNIQRFQFFNNDFSKKLAVTIEGFDAKGRLIHFQKNDIE